MNAHLDFALPEELSELSEHLNGPAWKSVVLEIDNILRNELKHGDTARFLCPGQALSWVRDELHKAIQNCGLDLHEPTFPESRTHPNRVMIDPTASPEEIIKSFEQVTPEEPNLNCGAGI